MLACADLVLAARPTAEQLLKHHWFADAAEGRLTLGECWHTHIQQPPRHCPKAARVRLQSLVFILQHDTLLAVLTHLVLTILPLSCRCYFSLASPPAADGSELEAVCPSTMVNLVGRLEAFAGMSRMKRLALVVLCHTVTDKHLMRLKVRCQLLTAASPAACMTACAAQSGLRQGQRSLPCCIATVVPTSALFW